MNTHVYLRAAILLQRYTILYTLMWWGLITGTSSASNPASSQFKMTFNDFWHFRKIILKCIILKKSDRIPNIAITELMEDKMNIIKYNNEKRKYKKYGDISISQTIYTAKAIN